MEEINEELNSQEAVEVDNETNNEVETQKTLDDYYKLEGKNKELYQRAKKAEEELKKLKQNELKQTNTQTTISREEVLLISKGYELSDIDKAKKLAELNGVSLLEAAEDEYIVSTVQKRKQTEISKRASLNASSGSPLPKADKTPGEMTREEHAEYFRKVMGV